MGECIHSDLHIVPKSIHESVNIGNRIAVCLMDQKLIDKDFLIINVSQGDKESSVIVGPHQRCLGPFIVIRFVFG
jgi:hypothetical protein